MKLERLTVDQAKMLSLDVVDEEDHPIYQFKNEFGYIIWDVYNPNRNKSAFCILMIYVSPGHRLCGHAKKLLAALSEKAKSEDRDVMTGCFTDEGKYLIPTCKKLGFIIEN